MLVTEDARTTLPLASGACIHKLHPAKARLSIFITEDAMLSEASFEQPLKAPLTILFPDTTVTCVSLEQLKYEFEAKAAGALSEIGLTPEKA